MLAGYIWEAFQKRIDKKKKDTHSKSSIGLDEQSLVTV